MTVNSTPAKNWIAFFIGVFTSISVRAIGTFSISEILALAALPFVGFSCLRNAQVKRFVVMIIVWLCGVIIADQYNDTPAIDAIKGSFNLILFILIIPFIYWLMKDSIRRIMYYAAGAGISGLIRYQFLYTHIDDWTDQIIRTYMLVPAVFFMGYYLYYHGRKILSYIVLEGYAFWTLSHGSRYIFLMVTIGIFLLITINFLCKSAGWEATQQKFRKRLFPIFIILGIAAIGASTTYTRLASSGQLGDKAKDKYEIQSSAKNGLASGRTDFMISLYAISKNPIVGYGSYAKDDYGLTISYEEGASYWNTYKGRFTIDRYEMIPGHSYILGAWVYAGILGLVFWIYVIAVILKFTMKYLCCYPRLLCYFVITICMMLWDIFFSPFANRLNFTMFIMPMLLMINCRGPIDAKIRPCQ